MEGWRHFVSMGLSDFVIFAENFAKRSRIFLFEWIIWFFLTFFSVFKLHKIYCNICNLWPCKHSYLCASTMGSSVIINYRKEKKAKDVVKLSNFTSIRASVFCRSGSILVILYSLDCVITRYSWLFLERFIEHYNILKRSLDFKVCPGHGKCEKQWNWTIVSISRSAIHEKEFLGLERFENIKSSSLLKQIVQNSKEKKKVVSSQTQKRVLERIMDHIKMLYSWINVTNVVYTSLNMCVTNFQLKPCWYENWTRMMMTGWGIVKTWLFFGGH